MLTTNPFEAPDSPFDPDGDKLREECGVFGIFGHGEAAALTALGLHALQHRGQEACGIVSYDGEHFNAHRALGQVGDNFSSEAVMAQLGGHAAIGHNRYATTGATLLRNVQPLFADFEFGGFAIGHNGNLTNAYQLRRQLVRRGCLFQSTTDTEVIVHLMATSRGGSVIDRMVEALRQIEGAYSVVALAKGCVIGIRDPLGVRPLVLGRLGDAHMVASETCALDIVGAEFVRDVKPGEMIIIDENGVTSMMPFQPHKKRFCVFEYVYFARPDSMVEGASVYEARKRIGAELAREAPADADVVIPVPDSGVPSAIGFAAESGMPFELGIIRNHYVGRTFIEPTDQIRHLGVKLKHNANRALIDGKKVVLVDDSIVRGTTSQKIVQMVRQAGAREVHMRISSPPTAHPCFYGIDTPAQEKLLAHNYSVEEMAKLIGVDSLAFITIDGLYRAMGETGRDGMQPQYCDACFTGDYPTALPDRGDASRKAELTFLAERRG
ncbi:amidophosphoribosyltransferase [Inquilinus sp. CAU 1745]|uniref:amidophosphoribosyltransferase n=1 Tax=Inquilinus sp. CAU 1745 TaxID=3140369 RepID=UPI00325B215C